MESFYQACLGLGTSEGHAESEALLLSLRSSPTGCELASEVLQLPPASFPTKQYELIAFHASLLLRDCAIRQYSLGRTNLLVDQLLRLSLLSTSGNKRTVEAMLQTVAALYKRAFGDNDKSGGNRPVLQLVLGWLLQDSHRWHASRVLLYLVWEFSITTGHTTALGQTMDFHIHCSRLFHDQFLQQVFVSASQSLWGRTSAGEEDGLLLDVLDACLNWPFEMFAAGATGQQPQQQTFAARRIDPGPQWRALLVADQSFAKQMTSYLASKPHAELARRTRQLLLLLCSLSGSVFASQQEQVDHSLYLCQIGFELASGGDVLDGCVMVSRALTFPKLDLLVPLVQQFPGLLPLTLNVARQCLSACTTDRMPYHDTPMGEALTSLLTVWVLLSTRANLPDNLRAAIGAVFAALVELKTLAAPVESLDDDQDDDGDDDDDQDGDHNEFVGDLASLARVNFAASLALVVRCCLEHPLAGFSPEARCECLGFQFQLLGLILADEDCPELPLAVLAEPQAASHASQAFLELFQQETSNRLREMSPLLSQTLLQSVSGWCNAYFSPSELPNELARFAQPLVLETLVHAACVHLQHFGGEEGVARASVGLLKIASQTKGQAIHQCSAWQAVCQAHLASLQTGDWSPLHLVGANGHGQLVGVLAASCNSVAQFNEYIFAPLYARLALKRPGDAVRLAEMFRGVARCPTTDAAVAFRVRECIAGSLKELLAMCGNGSRQDVLLSVLSVFADFCELHLSVAEPALLPEIYSTCAVLVQTFVSYHPQQQRKRDDAEQEFKAASLNKVLKLLIALSDRNYLDFSGSSGGDQDDDDEDDPSQIVLLGIHAILPLVDQDMFQLANVVDSFFDLVCGMCRLRAEYVANHLPNELFQSIVSSLAFGVRHHDAKIQRSCLESIASLCEDGGGGGGGMVQPALMADWQSLLLELVMTQPDMVGSTLDCAASALLQACKASPDTWPRAVDLVCGKALAHRRQGPLINPQVEDERLRALGETLRVEFAKLFDGVRVPVSDRTDRKRFACNVQAFAKVVRGFVLVV